MTEQLAFQQRVDDRRAVDPDERLAARRVAVDDPRDQLLPGAALSLDEHGGAAGGDAPHVLEQLLHWGRRADDVVQLHRPLRLDREEVGAAGEAPHFERAVERDVQRPDVDGLVDVVERACLHGQDGGGHVVVRGDHQDGRLAGALPQLRNEVDARRVGQAHVEDDRGGRGFLRELEPFGAGRRAEHAEAAFLEMHREQLPNGTIVVDDEDTVQP